MKIEIELKEVEALRNENKDLERQVERLKNDLQNNAQQKWEERAIVLSKQLFSDYMYAVFAKLGFENEDWPSVQFEDSWTKHINNDGWWSYKPERIKVSVGATVTDQLRNAFIKIGVIPKEEKPEEKKYKL